MADALARYLAGLRELDGFPDADKRTSEDEAKLDALVGELDDLYRALTPEQQRIVDAPRK